ncbi:MAG TPA: hypothetical protein VFS37_10900 [Conexibacter sp.]|nr:hypothetical protein [Conexibacter sp.]
MDALEDVSAGLLRGPILRTECTHVGGGDVDDTARDTGGFECIAVHEVNEDDGTMTGHRFAATVNYEDSTYTWHLAD